MTNRLALALCSALLLATGCVVDNPVAYDECVTVKDCGGAGANVCQGITVTWPGGSTSSAGICTAGCAGDLDCSASANGEYGLCARKSILGAPANTCFERCNTNADCAAGFLCESNKTVPGLAAYEEICVPAYATVPPLYDYEACTGPSSTQCAAVNGCITLTQNWTGGGTTTGNICSRGCVSDASCTHSYNGQNGYCSKAVVLNQLAGTCFERCYYDSDCISGYVCASDKDVSGLDIGERICVPGGAGMQPQTQDWYSTCSAAADCPVGASTTCANFDPKWNTTTAQFALDVCTSTCTSNASCPIDPFLGLQGFCAPAGTVATQAVCLQRCVQPSDCAPGFLCAYANGVTGIAAADAVCLPDPQYGY